MMRREPDKRREKLSSNATSGVVALIFLVLGFQLAIFVVKVVQKPAPVEAVAEEVEPVQPGGTATDGSDAPSDYRPYQRRQYGRGGGRSGAGGRRSEGRSAASQPQKSRWGGYEAPPSSYQSGGRPKRSVESFPFDPNTVSLEDLVRLGLSERQAESIENYRSKGGKFRVKEDFKKMYVVTDSLYERLEPFIDIPKVELNSADSTALVSLRGIGPYYARKIIEYRESLGGFYAVDQLLEVYGMDEERFAPLRECVKADASLIRPLDIWTLPEDSLARHPYLGRSGARSIVRFRRICPDSLWNAEGLLRENVLDSVSMIRLRHYIKE
ncbi:MAG: helix-hairpin-helix domain-containing protein [Bacteroidales bacterium]|nr:helix-hairpin-helix domain-containing protein [Bacteroidales bacterium]